MRYHVEVFCEGCWVPIRETDSWMRAALLASAVYASSSGFSLRVIDTQTTPKMPRRLSILLLGSDLGGC